jgi:hypothetical protein
MHSLCASVIYRRCGGYVSKQEKRRVVILDTDNNIYHNLKSILLCQPPIYVCTLNDIIHTASISSNRGDSDHLISSFLFLFCFKKKREKMNCLILCVCMFESFLCKERKSKQSSNIMSMYTHVTRQLHSFKIDV